MTSTVSQSTSGTSGSRPFRTVLAGSAIDDQSDVVVRTARNIARRTGAGLVVVHAAPLPVLTPGNPTATHLLRRMREDLEEELLGQAGRLDLDSMSPPAVLRLESGPPDLVLARVAQECSADLVVVGATTATGRLGKLLGSTAERLLAWGKAPVLIVRQELLLPPQRVLAPLDMSASSRDAFRAGLRLLAILAPTEDMEIETLLVLPAPAPESLPHAIRLAQTELEDFLSGLPAAPGMRMLPLILTGEAREQILLEAAQADWSLILMGTRGTTGIRRARASVNAEISRAAPCSVLVVPSVLAAEPAVDGDETAETKT